MKRGLIVLMIVLAAAALLITVWPSAAQTADDDPIQVGVVIQGADGQPQTFCVTLDGDHPTGRGCAAGDRAGPHVQAGRWDQRSAGSRMMAARRRETCFCQCEGGATCAYWTYFHLNEEGNWQYSTHGAAQSRLSRARSRAGGGAMAVQPPMHSRPISFDDICGGPDFPRTVTDGLGREVTIESAAADRLGDARIG